MSSLNTARDASIDTQGDLWVATTGGVFSVDKATDVITEYRNINALQSLDATSIHCGSNGEVFVGGGDGALDILDANGTWVNITDIKRANEYPKRAVRDLLLYNDVLYIATDFGVVTFKASTRLFIETIDRIGTFQEKTRVNGVAIRHDSIWVATDSGVAVAPLNVSTLRLPSVWTVLDTASGVGKETASFIASSDNDLAIAIDKRVLKWNGVRFESIIEQPEVINGLTITSTRVIASTGAGVFDINGVIFVPWAAPLNGHLSYAADGNLNIIGFVRDRAVQMWNGTELTPVNLNSPITNQFARCAVDTKGGLWVATDVDPPRTGSGVMYYDGNTWTNYNVQSTPDMTTNACYRVSALSNGNVVVGTFGDGALVFTPSNDGFGITRYDETNSVLQGVSNSPDFVLVADAALDRYGATWYLNEQAVNQILVQQNTDGGMNAFPNCKDPQSNIFRCLAIDGSNTKWFGSFWGNGVIAYNDRNTSSTSDDVCNRVLISNSQLPDNVVSVLRMDKTGALWIGTAKGVAVIASPSSVSNSSVPYVRRISVLAAPVVNDIYVDALNYKWIATTGGVFVLNEDGTEVIATITRSNAPLLDDNVRCVAVDELTGRAYFGTTFGCTSVQTSSIRPSETFSLSVRPQPFSPQSGEQVIIDGLAEDADVRIVTTGGIMVQAIQARGRQAIWDGKDTMGRYAPTGVYVVIARSSTTKESAITKIVVK